MELPKNLLIENGINKLSKKLDLSLPLQVLFGARIDWSIGWKFKLWEHEWYSYMERICDRRLQ